VEVKTSGFTTSQKVVQVQVGQSVLVNVQLSLSTASTTVEVSEAATLAQTDNANLATTFDSTQLQNLPAPGNDITSYAFTAPGVSVSSGGGYGNFTVFGLPGVSNLYTVNGTDNMDPYLNLNNSGASNLTLGANEIQEAAVVMNGYSGQYGRQAGAQVNYVTKSGTNAFHGNAGWFYNGRVLNANDFFNNATGTDPINPAFNANSVQPQYGGQLGYTRVINTSMVNQLMLSGSYYSAIFGPSNLSAALSAFPTTWAFTDGLYNSNNATGTSLGGEDQRYPAGRKVRQHQLIDDLSITHGTHNFKVGVNARRNFISTYAYGSNTSGLLTFNSMTDFVNGSLTAGSTYSQTFANIGAENISLYSLGFYGQDEWKVRRNLTLTLTLRFDRNSNISCAANCFNEFLQTFPNIDHSATTPYNSTIHTGLSNAFPNVEAIVPEPRVGFAYSVTPSTVIRGGVGLFTDLYQAVIADRLITNSPAVATFSTPSGLVALNDSNSVFAKLGSSAAAFRNGFTGGATLAQLKAGVPGFTAPAFNTIPNKLFNPKYWEWNLEVQHSLNNKLLLSVNYVGNHGYHEFNSTLFGNAYSPTGFQGLPASVPDARFGEIRELNNQSYSNYEGMVASLRWRLSQNFTGAFNYTLGHALDTCSNLCIEPFNLLTAPSLRYQVNPLSLSSLNYSNADYDVRHTISANYVYTMPNRFRNAIMKGVLGGWTAAGTVIFHSGYPFSVINSGVRNGQVSNVTGIATATFLADYLGGSGYPDCTTPNVACFSRSQFATAASQHDFGNIPRNSFRGPGYFDTDLNLNKTFAITERYHLLIGAYFFNILNHPNFDLPGNNVPGGNFGLIQSTVGPPTSAYGSFQGSAVSGRVIPQQAKFTF
jgi:hypothetical protein